MKTAVIDPQWVICECGCPRDAHDNDFDGHETACFGCVPCWEFKERKE